MTRQEEFTAELQKLLPKEAFDWLMNFQSLCNAIDDIIDETDKRLDNEFIIRTFFQSCELYTTDFYHEHRRFLYPTILLITNAYADSVAFEGSKEEWQRRIGDVSRCAFAMMVQQIIYLFVSYEKLRELSPKLLACGWFAHHDKNNTPH